MLGGTSLFGGKGTILGTIQGVLILGLIEKAMVIFNVDTNYQLLLRGTIILVVIVTDALTRVEEGARSPREAVGITRRGEEVVKGQSRSARKRS